MTTAIHPSATPSVIQPVQPLSPAGQSQETRADFGAMLHSAIAHVESSGTAAAHSVEQFISGEAVDLHSVALSSQKAALDFEMLLQVRNKVVQAYQEVMRLQL